MRKKKRNSRSASEFHLPMLLQSESGWGSPPRINTLHSAPRCAAQSHALTSRLSLLRYARGTRLSASLHPPRPRPPQHPHPPELPETDLASPASPRPDQAHAAPLPTHSAPDMLLLCPAFAVSSRPIPVRRLRAQPPETRCIVVEATSSAAASRGVAGGRGLDAVDRACQRRTRRGQGEVGWGERGRRKAGLRVRWEGQGEEESRRGRREGRACVGGGGW
eukprot:3362747-Rhodomonas_salina.3